MPRSDSPGLTTAIGSPATQAEHAASFATAMGTRQIITITNGGSAAAGVVTGGTLFRRFRASGACLAVGNAVTRLGAAWEWLEGLLACNFGTGTWHIQITNEDAPTRSTAGTLGTSGTDFVWSANIPANDRSGTTGASFAMLAPSSLPTGGGGGTTVANTFILGAPGTAQTNYPFQLGRHFPETGLGVIANFAQPVQAGTPLTNWQCDVKQRWPNGNLKFALISFIVPTLATADTTFSFQNSATADNTPITVAQMLAAPYDFDGQARVAVSGTPVAGSPSSARSILSAIADSTLTTNTTNESVNSRYWTAGPVCTTVIICDHTTKAHDVGTNSTKPLRPWYVAQFWPGINRCFVEDVLESSDTTRVKHEDVDVSFWVGNTTPVQIASKTAHPFGVFTKQHRGAWIGTQIPTCKYVPNIAYLASLGVINNHAPVVNAVPGTVEASWVTEWAARPKGIGDVGFMSANTTAGGGRSEMYFVPRWTGQAMMHGWPILWDITKAHSQLAGSWQVHYREGDAARTIMSSAGQGRIVSKATGGRPTWFNLGVNRAETVAPDQMTVDGSPSLGVLGYATDGSHLLDLHYHQYILKGDYLAYEGLQQYAAWAMFSPNPGTGSYANNVNGRAATDILADTIQPRSEAWIIRTWARAWAVALDSQPWIKDLWTKAHQDTQARIRGLFGLARPTPSGAVYDAWNANFAQWWPTNQVTNPAANARPNALGYSSGGLYDMTANRPTDSTTLGASVWMQGYQLLAVTHAKELGITGYDEIREFYARPLLQIAQQATKWEVIAADAVSYQKSTGPFYQSATELFANWASPPNSYSSYTNSNGFAASGSPGTWAVNLDNYAAVAKCAIAAVYDLPGGPAAWAKVQPAHDLTVSQGFYGYDPRWSMIPRGL